MDISLKLLPPPASNYIEWERSLIEKVQSSRDYSFLGSCLRAGRQLPPQYLFSEVPEDFFHEESKAGVPLVTPTVESISSSRSSSELIVKAKAKIMDELGRIAILKYSLFDIILTAISDPSKRLVCMHNSFSSIRETNDIYGLWGLIRRLHRVNSIAHSIDLENKLQRFRWSTQEFPVFLERFEIMLQELESLDAKVREPKAAYLLLAALLESPLEHAVKNLMFLGEENLPQTFAEAKKRMENAFGMLPVPDSDITEELTANVVAVQAERRVKKCVHCQQEGHYIQHCPRYLEGKPRINGNKKKISAYSCFSSVSDNIIILDTGSNAHILSTKELFSKLVPCHEVVVGAHGGKFDVLQRGETVWGPAYLLPQCPLNLISLSVLVANGFQMAVSKDSKTITVVKDLATFVFSLSKSGLYEYRAVMNDALAMSAEHFTAEQRKRADMVTELHRELNHPSPEQLCNLLDSSCLIECPLTSRDVRVSERINGSCPECLVGKYVSPPALVSESTPASSVGELLHTDIVYFLEGKKTSVPFLMIVDDFSDYVHCVRMKNKTTQTLLSMVMDVVNEYKSWGHRVQTIRSDYEIVYRSIRSQINAQGIRMEYAAPGAHERKAERTIQILRNQFRTILGSVPFDVPAIMFPKMLCDIATTMNMLPTARSKPSCPYYIATGRKISRKNDLKAPFGCIVVVKNLEDRKNAKGVIGVVVGRDGYSKGTLIIYLLDSGVFVARAHIKKIQPTEDIIRKLNNRAKIMSPSIDCQVAHVATNLVSPTTSISEVDQGYEWLCKKDDRVHADIQSSLPILIQDADLNSPDEPSTDLSVSPNVNVIDVVQSEVVVPVNDVPCVNETDVDTRDSLQPPLHDVDVPIQPHTEDLSYSIPYEPGSRKSGRARKGSWKAIQNNNIMMAFHLTMRQAEVKYPGLGTAAAASEMHQLISRGTIEPIYHAPKGEKLIHSQLMTTPKYDQEGELLKIKGRLVASGNEIDRTLYPSTSCTSAPTLKFEGLMVILSTASFHNSIVGTLDYPGAFLNAWLKKHRYMFLGRDATAALLSVHPEFTRYRRNDGTMLVKVKGALYGLPESGKEWYDCLSSFLVESGYRQCATDNCIFFKESGNDKIIFGLHVDDKFYSSTSQALVDELIMLPTARFGSITHDVVIRLKTSVEDL